MISHPWKILAHMARLRDHYRKLSVSWLYCGMGKKCLACWNKFESFLQFCVLGLCTTAADADPLWNKDNHDRERAQADRQLQHLNRERDELERHGRGQRLLDQIMRSLCPFFKVLKIS